jgi:prefoldin subunit 5
MEDKISETKQQELQQKYLKVELLSREYEQVCTQEDLINNKTAELALLKKSIDKIENGESFSQIGSGIFVFSKIIDNNTFLVNIGKRLFVKMNKEEIKEHLDKKLRDLEKVFSNISERKKALESEIQRQVMELQSLQ